MTEEAELRRLYVDEGLSLKAVGRELGTTSDRVRTRLARAGIPVRRPGAPPRTQPLEREWLADVYTVQRLDHEEIAKVAGCSVAHVRNELRRHGIGRRRGVGPLPAGGAALTPELLEELYIEQGLTTAEVAERVGGSPARVLAGVRRAGIPTRAPGTPSGRRLIRLTPELLHQLYVVEGLSAAQVAERVGGDGKRVWAALVRAGIPRRPRARPPRTLNASREELVVAYVEERVSIDELADRYGVPPFQVRLKLRAEGIRRPPPGSPAPTAPPLDELARLYVDEGRTLAQLAAQYHTSGPHVRAWLVEAGVTIAPRTSRQHRRELPVEAIEEWYWEEGCTAAEIAERLGATGHKVLRCLHDAGVAVRLGGIRRDRDEAMCVLDELYADADVRDALVRHEIPERREPGSIAERFPQPAALTPALLEELYATVGLSARHIELLTGQPADQVLDALHDCGVAVRTGFSPWRQRRVS
jgi:DNA-binding CsgD family transcriptional regulator/transposase-like protein